MPFERKTESYMNKLKFYTLKLQAGKVELSIDCFYANFINLK